MKTVAHLSIRAPSLPPGPARLDATHALPPGTFPSPMAPAPARPHPPTHTLDCSARSSTPGQRICCSSLIRFGLRHASMVAGVMERALLPGKMFDETHWGWRSAFERGCRTGFHHGLGGEPPRFQTILRRSSSAPDLHPPRSPPPWCRPWQPHAWGALSACCRPVAATELGCVWCAGTVSVCSLGWRTSLCGTVWGCSGRSRSPASRVCIRFRQSASGFDTPCCCCCCPHL